MYDVRITRRSLVKNALYGFTGGGYAVSREVAQWKKRVHDAWSKVWISALELPRQHANFGDKVRFTVVVNLDGLQANDIAVELLMSSSVMRGRSEPASYMMHPEGERLPGGEQRYSLELAPELCGKLEYRIRAITAGLERMPDLVDRLYRRLRGE